MPVTDLIFNYSKWDWVICES